MRSKEIFRRFLKYDKLAKIMVERMKADGALHFPFMIDLEMVVRSKTSVGMWIGNRISCVLVGRFVSMSSICRTGKFLMGNVDEGITHTEIADNSEMQRIFKESCKIVSQDFIAAAAV